MKLAFLYAGQGSQHPGMGRDLYEAYPTFRSVLDSVQLDFDLKKVSFEGPAEVLSQTQYTQPCLVAFAAGVTSLLYQNGIRPSFAAGLSLGEYSALHAAGVLDARTAIELVAFRGEAMARAAAGRPSAMAAVLLLGREELQRCCEEAAPFGVAEIANLNCPGQTVIGGDAQAVAEAGRLALARGAKRVIPLQVSGPFHTSLMAPAGRALEERFRQTSFGAMKFPVLFNCTGDVLGPGETIPGLLVRQVQSAVRMEEILRNMAEHGVDTVVEIGPGRALSGFVKKTCKGVRCYGVETVAELEEAVAALRGAGA
jgi:[acyl-carrier-protein] S-malonyltransferase